MGETAVVNLLLLWMIDWNASSLLQTKTSRNRHTAVK